MTLITVIDVETSGFDDEDPRVIELAAVRVNAADLSIGAVRSWLFSPGGGRRVSARASAVHHLTDADLVDCPVFGDEAWVEACAGADILCAHNAAFDKAAVARSVSDNGPRFLCTYKLALVAWPEAPSHSNQALRYFTGVTPALPADLYPHRAAYDALTTAALLVKLLAHFDGDLAPMLRISESPARLVRVGFGKNRGKRWADMDDGFLRWVLERDFDDDVKYTAESILKERC